MPVWISQASLIPLPLMVYALLFMVNLLVIMFKARHVYHLYKRDNSKDLAMHRLRTISRYANGVSSLVIWYTIVVFILPSIGVISRLTAIIAAMFLPFIGTCVLLIIEHFTLYDLIRRICDTTETKSEGLARKFRGFVFNAIPDVIFWLPIIAFSHPGGPNKLHKMSISTYVPLVVFGTIFGTLYLLLMSWIRSWFVPLALGARQVADNQFYGKLFAITRKAGLKGLKIYIWPGSKNKHGNAMFSGLINKKIFISDYLLEQLSDEELEYVLGHEIGHAKRGHLWIYIFLIAFLVALIIVVDEVSYIFLPNISLAIRFPIIITVVILYRQAVINYISRILEKEADKYSLQMGIRPMVAILALYKLAKLNHSPVHLNKFDESMQTHPSIANRIKWIMNKNNVTEKELTAKGLELFGIYN